MDWTWVRHDGYPYIVNDGTWGCTGVVWLSAVQQRPVQLFSTVPAWRSWLASCNGVHNQWWWNIYWCLSHLYAVVTDVLEVRVRAFVYDWSLFIGFVHQDRMVRCSGISWMLCTAVSTAVASGSQLIMRGLWGMYICSERCCVMCKRGGWGDGFRCKFMHRQRTYITHLTKQGSFSKRWGTFPLLTCTQGCGEKKNHGVSSGFHYSLHGFSSLHRSIMSKYLKVLKKSLVW